VVCKAVFDHRRLYSWAEWQRLYPEQAQREMASQRDAASDALNASGRKRSHDNRE
jgi:hypothetical protein